MKTFFIPVAFLKSADSFFLSFSYLAPDIPAATAAMFPLPATPETSFTILTSRFSDSSYPSKFKLMNGYLNNLFPPSAFFAVPRFCLAGSTFNIALLYSTIPTGYNKTSLFVAPESIAIIYLAFSGYFNWSYYEMLGQNKDKCVKRI